MKKVLFITSNDNAAWGGSEELWLACATEALNYGLQVGICVRWDPLPQKLLALANHKNLSFFNKQGNYTTKKYNSLVPNRFKIENLYLDKILAWKPDLLILSQGNNADGLPIMEFCIANSIKYCSISQAVYEGIWPDTLKADKMRNAYSNALANYFVSKANLKLTGLQIGGDVKNGEVVYNPFNVPYNNNLPYPDTTTYKLACVARYEFYAKGQDVLLEVLSQDKWKKRNVVTTFYGSGPNEDGMRRLIEHFDLKNVHIGGQRVTSDIWRDNHALVLPSRFEGLPLALVEAMLSGRFGIVSDVSGNKEAFVDGETGFLAEAPKAEYLDSAMEIAWERRAEWENIGRKASGYIKTIFPENPGKELFKKILTSYIDPE